MKRLVAVCGGFALVMLAGCSSGSGSTPASTDDGWSGRTNVEAVFQSYCSGCHASQWDSCWVVSASAGEIEPEIESGDMPQGTTMAPADKATLTTWFSQGAPCAGTPPADAGATMITVPSG